MMMADDVRVLHDILDTDTIFITMYSKESNEGESHCLIERWFLYIRATSPPRPGTSK